MSELKNQLEQALGGRLMDPIPDTPTVDIKGDIPIVEAGQGTEADPLVEMLAQAVRQPEGWYADDEGDTPESTGTPPSTPAPTGNSLNAGVEGDEQLTAWLNNRLNS